jgi:prepilin-type N-terminal cleavage/methylation domain-containing protein
MPQTTTRPAFTLVELLVVITIIVVLLALLTPALNTAIYRAELTVCASQLRGIGMNVTMYANEYKRYYPYRGLERVNNAANGNPPNYDQPAIIKYHPVTTERPFDQRETLRRAMAINKALNDPLTGELDMEADAEIIFTSYNLWWGFTYYNQPSPKAMNKLGDYWNYSGDRFDVLAGDRDLVRPGTDVQTSHSDEMYGEGTLYPRVWQNEQGPWLIAAGRMTFSCWYSSNEQIALTLAEGRRSPVDNNFVMSDGSVRQYDRVHWNRFEELDRIRTVSTFSNGWRGSEQGHDYMYVP